MNLFSLSYSLNDFPIVIAIVDLNFQLKTYSRIWLKEFPSSYDQKFNNISLKAIHNIPNEVIEKIATILNGENKKFETLETKSNQNIWFQWKINPLKNEKENINGAIIIAENITEKKRKEELFLQAETVAKVGGWEVDLISNTIYWSDVTKAIHELPISYVPNLEEGVNFYKAGEHRELISNSVSEAINNGTPWDEELQIITAKGNEIWVRSKGQAEIIDGKCIRIFGTFQDIDLNKREQLNYKKISDRLKIATSTSKTGIWEYEIATNSLIWDDNMFELYNIPKTNNNVIEIWENRLHPDDKERCLKDRERALTGEEEPGSVFRIIWPNGEIRYLKSQYTIQKNNYGELIRIIGSNWDITELKNTQLKLSKNEESFKGAFEKSSMGMALVGIDGSWIDVNESISKSLGFTREELLKLRFQDITHPDDLNKDLAFLTKILNGKIQNYQIEKRYFHKDGSIVYAILTVTAVRDFQGRLSHFISQLMNITSRIKAENKSKELIELTENQNKSLLNFAHIVSHNLRSHSTNLSMLTSFLKDEKDAAEKEHLENMLNDASESLSETVSHLNEVVQITTSTKEQLKTVNLLKAIKNVEKNISALIQEKKVLCNFEVPKDLNIMAVPAYLESILLNLFTNSIKYSSPNRRPEITIVTKVINDKLILNFTDNGQGIDLNRHGKKLFGMYKTFHEHKDAKGIGLFITKNQIEAMNGNIEVKSIVDKGTTFILSFDKEIENSGKKVNI